MTEPGQDRNDGGAPAAPTVSTAPAAGNTTSPDVAPGHRWWSSIPRNLGRARTSTVVLSLLFVGVFALYLNVRPPAPGQPTAPDPASDPAVVEEPVDPTPTGSTPTTTAPAPTGPTAPTTTGSRPTTGQTGSTPRTTTPPPTGSPTGPGPSEETEAPTRTGSPDEPSVPESPAG